MMEKKPVLSTLLTDADSSLSSEDECADFTPFRRKKSPTETSAKPLPSDEEWKDEQELEAEDELEQACLFVHVMAYIGFTIIVIFGYLRDLLRFLQIEHNPFAKESAKLKGFVHLYSDFASFYKRNVYVRFRDVTDRPLCSAAGGRTTLLERSHDTKGSYKFTGRKLNVINMGSYNYLGFAENDSACALEAKDAVARNGLTVCSRRQELGNTKEDRDLERVVAKFLGAEDALCFPMGFCTNSMNIPALVGKNCLILSDELNHASLILGSRMSGSITRIFKHNDMEDLEKQLREAIIYGHPRTKRAYAKILICVEGIYSMEGTIVHLPQLIALKKKYKAYLYLDEAHSIGALGPRGGGVCEFWGCDVKDVDILMGTFTKSFGSAGGYIAGSKRMISYLRIHSQSCCYSSVFSPPVARQATAAFRSIMEFDSLPQVGGLNRIEQLAKNTRYFREQLKAMGFIVYGNRHSPVVPLMLYMPSKMSAFSRLLLERKIASVVVTFPATPLTLARARFCISSSHTKEMLDEVLAVIDDVGNILNCKYSSRKRRKENGSRD